MPAKSEKQRRFFGAALARKRAGKSKASDPDLSEQELSEFAASIQKRAMKKGGKRDDG